VKQKEGTNPTTPVETGFSILNPKQDSSPKSAPQEDGLDK
jgi:hypothetical protein